MHTKTFVTLIIVVLVLLALWTAGSTLAQTSTHYDLSWNVLGNGGGAMDSTNYGLRFTVGQAVAGGADGTDYGLGAGFWQTEFFQVYLPLVLRQYP
ncbi:MAG: hypothetical protein KKA73_25785 [Chloroflexi bacterium]|nr:hypothetical protein [Chloroflexota bacterium]MBU1751110.1 hypothetical protein [Chloroflexota bacterium]